MKKIIFISLLLFHILGGAKSFWGQDFYRNDPHNAEFAIAGSIFALYYVYEGVVKEAWYFQPRWEAPNTLDSSVRNQFKWNDSNLSKAALYSDILLFGVFASSIAWAPLIIAPALNFYQPLTLILLETAAVTSMVNLIAKISFARQRPYAHFKTLPAKGTDDNLSFYSGHSSFSFAIATAFSFLLSESNSRYKILTYSIAYSLAAITAYLRVAADKHYFTDVVTGAVVGSAIGYLYSQFRLKSSGNPGAKIGAGAEPGLQLQLYTKAF